MNPAVGLELQDSASYGNPDWVKIDPFRGPIPGGSGQSLSTELALDTLEQALYARRAPAGLVHHSDRSVQYLSIRYTERLVEAGIASSVGSVSDAYDNALAETIIGLYKTEVIEQLRL